MQSTDSKRRRCNSGELKRGASMDFSLRSEDFNLDPLKSEDILSDKALGPLNSEDLAIRLESADIAEDVLLPDTAVTAAAALKAEQQPTSIEGKSPIQHEKIGKLKAKLERRSTGDDLVPLNMSFRISSGNWIKDFESESGDLVAMHPSLFLGSHPSQFKHIARDAEDPSASPLPYNTCLVTSRGDNYEQYEVPIRSSGCKPPMPSLKNARVSSSDWVKDFQGESVDLGPMHPSLFIGAIAAPLSTNYHPVSRGPYRTHLVSPQRLTTSKPPKKRFKTVNGSPPTSQTASASKANAPLAPSTTTTGKKKKSRKRLLDETRAVEPTDDDVLSGRGGFTNTHPGNIRFRQKALEFRPWYEESSKEKKQEIADLLVDFVLSSGHRFLGKGEDGLWHEMVGKGPHYKASQALRERIRGESAK